MSDPCPECPGQHEVTLTFTVCSACDSTIALSHALAQALAQVRGGFVKQYRNSGAPPIEVNWVLKAIEVAK